MWASDITGTIGQTPLVRLNRVTAGLRGTILAKVEFFNPGGSVKDRIGLAMVEAAERDGRIKPGGTLIECTSGNTGAGVALAAITKGYRCIFTTTDKQSQEKLDVLRALGAEVIVCPTAVAPDDPRSYYSVARRLETEIPGSVLLNQYDNPANAQAHYDSTGPELWEQTDGRITHYIAGAGTGGTISGTTRYLKEHNPAMKTIGVDPYGSVYYSYFHSGGVFDEKEIYPYLIEGVGEDILAGNMDFKIVDDFVRVTDRDAMVMTRRLAREEGLFIGQSCGMAVSGAIAWLREHADELTDESVVVILLPDSGFRYLAKTYNDAWMQQHGFLESRPTLTAASVLATCKRTEKLVAASPEATLADAITEMAAHGVSQVPVFEDGAPIGSLSESSILGRLLRDPSARDLPVREVMGEPFPVVPASLHLDHLTAYLEQGDGAVLVHDEASGTSGYGILTRADLISALAHSGRQN